MNLDVLTSAHGDDLTRVVLETAVGDLALVLDNPHLEEKHVLLMLRRHELPVEVVMAISERPRWMSGYLIKAAIVSHPNTPKTFATGLVKYLFWRDLARLVSAPQVDPLLRKMAEIGLRDRLGEISLGEKITLARLAPREVVKAFRSETNERVMSALLENPRCTDEDVSMIANNLKTPSRILELLARTERFMARPSLRVALIRNPRTPTRAAWQLLPALADHALRDLLDAPTLSPVLRQAVERLLEERRGRHSGPLA